MTSDFRMPAEWSPHRACWLAWPWDASLWQEHLPGAQSTFVGLCAAIADQEGPGAGPAEVLEILVPDAAYEAKARRRLGNVPARFHHIPVGDIWLRDTAPLFLTSATLRTTGEPTKIAASFRFNGWGGKYVLPHDDAVSAAIGEASGLPVRRHDFVLEGGSVEVDGEGSVLTTRQCLLNPNRNPRSSQAQVETWLHGSLGTSKVLWLERGLLNDHTDGHIDTLARFVAPGAVVCMQAQSADDPNARVLEDIARALESFTDAQGRRLRVHRVVSPGRVTDGEGRVMPASYVNYYQSNRRIIVPLYGVPSDEIVLEQLAELFPDRGIVGIPALEILSGGGAFHCITQQEPL